MSVLYNVMQVAGWSVKHDVVQDLKIGSAHQKWSVTEARQSMNPPEEPQQKSSWDHHTPPQTPPQSRASPQAQGQTTGQPDCSFKFVGKGRPTSPRRYHTSPQLSAPFPNDHIVVVDDENSFEQVRFWRGVRSWKRQFLHILKFWSNILYSVGRRVVGVCLSLGDHPADPQQIITALLGRVT